MASDSLTRAFDTSERELRLDKVLAAYVEAVEAGKPPDREVLLAAHPDLAEELREFFANRDGIEQAMGAVRRSSSGVLPKLRYFGDYELLEEVARGGMGIVYKARQTSLNRTVAVKMILAGQLATPEDVRRFRTEAEAAANLQHANIVAVHEVGIHDNQHYFSMEFVEGKNLAALVRENPLPALRAAEYVQIIARAVHYAHQQGTLHRDLKPSNVLIDTRDQVRITDFGLATRVTDDQTLTRAGQILGTPSYMAPEQAAGKRNLVGPAADIYSLGVILYELLTGRPPFRAESAVETLHQVMHVEPASPRLLNPHIPRDLETICLKCLQKEPHNRYGTAELLADDLVRYLDGKPILARPVGRAERLWRFSRRNPVIASLTATVALALMLGAGVSTYFAIEASARARAEAEARLAADAAAQQERTARQDEAEARKAAERSREETKAESRRVYRTYYAAQMNLTQRDWEQADMTRLRKRLIETQPQHTGGEDLRGFEWSYWERLAHSELKTLVGDQWRSVDVAFSPDGRQIATADWNSTATLWDATSGRKLFTLKVDPHLVTSVAFSPDGRRLLTAGWNGTVKVWDTTSGREHNLGIDHRDVTAVEKGPASPVHHATFTADGRRIASASGDRTIKLWDATSGEELMTLKGHQGSVQGVAFSPDGRRLASLSVDRTMKVWDAISGEATLTFKAVTASKPAFSPDGRRLTAAGENHTLKVWDADSGEELLSLKGHASPVSRVVFSPDGTRLASAGSDHTIKLWDATTGQELLTLKGHTNSVHGVAFSPDGRRLASTGADHMVKIWDATAGQEPITLKADTFRVRSAAFSPDGKRIASAAGFEGSTVRVWDTTSGRAILTLKGHTLAVHCVTFSPDGRRLATAGYDKTVRLWDSTSGKLQHTLTAHAFQVASVAFSPDGRRLASGDYANTIKIWDAESGQETLSLNMKHVQRVTFSPDGRRLACAADYCAKVWDAINGQELLMLRHSDWVKAVAFSPDGHHLTTGSSDEVKLWDAASGQETLTLHGHKSLVWDVVFSPDGRRLASASYDDTAKLWDVASGQELLTLRGHGKNVNSVTFSSDGLRLATASADQTVKIWDARPWTAESRTEHETRGLLMFLRARVKSHAELTQRLQADQTIDSSVRDKALEWSDLFWSNESPRVSPE